MFRKNNIIIVTMKMIKEIKASKSLAVFGKNNYSTKTFSLQGKNRSKDIGPVGWFLLLIPTTTFGLGTWQVQRKKWKEGLIADLQSRSQSQPIELPEDYYHMKSLEYYPIKVTGVFDHSKELYMGPRSLIRNGESASSGGLMSQGNRGNVGYYVITPFKLLDRNITILVNRGWVPANKKNPHTRPDGQITGEITIKGVVRLNENRPTFTPNNQPHSNSWMYRDLEAMCNVTGAEPVFLEATEDSTIDGGPIGGQTRISLRNEHLSYILTWYSLCGFTSFMWYRKFIMKLPLI